MYGGCGGMNHGLSFFTKYICLLQNPHQSNDPRSTTGHSGALGTLHTSFFEQKIAILWPLYSVSDEFQQRPPISFLVWGPVQTVVLTCGHQFEKCLGTGTAILKL